jgi:peptidoglycan/LPS O-acetylase OafA/YrhL
MRVSSHPAGSIDGTDRNVPVFFPSVDILRGFAAISVLVYHVIEHFKWITFPKSGLLFWFRIGGMGVDLFFVISGFVIGLSAFSAIDKLGESGFRSVFSKRRFFRIAPLYYLTLLVYLVFVTRTFSLEAHGYNIILHVFFAQSFFVDYFGAINGPNWSVSIEMQFYLLILFIAPCIRLAKCWKIACVFILIAWCWRVACFYFVQSDGPQGVFPLFVATSQLPGMLDVFCIGLLLARFIRSDTGLSLLEKNKSWNWILLSAAVSAIVSSFVLYVYLKNASYWGLPLMVIFFKTPLALAYASVVFVACTLNNGSWLKVTTPLRYMGVLSYGIYLWHLPVLLSVQKIEGIAPQEALPIIMGITVLLAAASWHFFEKPIMKSMNRWKPLHEISRRSQIEP